MYGKVSSFLIYHTRTQSQKCSKHLIFSQFQQFSFPFFSLLPCCIWTEMTLNTTLIWKCKCINPGVFVANPDSVDFEVHQTNPKNSQSIYKYSIASNGCYECYECIPIVLLLKKIYSQAILNITAIRWKLSSQTCVYIHRWSESQN